MRHRGNGLLLFVRVDDFDSALQRYALSSPGFEEEPHVNPNTQTKEVLAPGSGRIFTFTISAL